MVYYSVLIETREGTGKNERLNSLTVADYTEEELRENIILPYLQGKQFIIDGYVLDKSKIQRIKVVASDRRMDEIIEIYNQKNKNSGVVWIYNERDVISRDTMFVKNVTNDFLSPDALNERASSIENNFNNNSRQVFIVHGHDDEMKLDVSNFLRRLELEPIILDEQANKGKTIIEKIEEYTNVGYGIVLYTPCDMGGPINFNQDNMKPRARQNVVFEHGYLIGKLGRDKVCALCKGDVEYPSDISGVVYIPYQKQGDWQLRIAKELKMSGYEIKLDKLT